MSENERERSLIREAWDKASIVVSLLLLCGLVGALGHNIWAPHNDAPAQVVPQSSVEWIQGYTDWAEAEGGVAFAGQEQVTDELLPLIIAWCDAHLEQGYTLIRYVQYEGLWFTEIMGVSPGPPRDEGGELWCLVLALDKQGKWVIAGAWLEDTYTAMTGRGEG